MSQRASVSNVYSAPSGIHGTGVFAANDLDSDDVAEVCPVIIVPAEQVEALDKTVIYNYYYEWTEGAAAVALGLGSLYNHSFSPNSTYELDEDGAVIVIRTLTAIRKGEEVTFNYTGTGDDPSLLWFDANPQTTTQSQTGVAPGK